VEQQLTGPKPGQGGLGTVLPGQQERCASPARRLVGDGTSFTFLGLFQAVAWRLASTMLVNRV
jgi:hypothetical protein